MNGDAFHGFGLAGNIVVASRTALTAAVAAWRWSVLELDESAAAL